MGVCNKTNGRLASPLASLNALALAFLLFTVTGPASAQSPRCEIPREARDIWRCERGFVIGPENVIIRLPIPETDPEALYNAGIEAARREDWRVAIAYFTAAHQRAHLVPRYMYNLGLAHARAGNEAPAIAWLTAYLVAEPDTSARAAIWVQIAGLEAAAQAQVAQLWSQSLAAAATLPAPQQQQVTAWIGNLRAPPAAELSPSSDTLASLPETRLTPQFVNRNANGALGHEWWPILTAAHRGGRPAMVVAAQQLASAGNGGAEADAALGRGAAAVSWAGAQTDAGFDGYYSELVRSRVSEILLYSGDVQNAAEAARLAQSSDAVARFRGLLGARAHALVLAHTTTPFEAVEFLQIFYTRRITNSNHSGAAFSPAQRWSHARFDARGLIAEHLVRVDRLQDAIGLAGEIDTLRRERFASWVLERTGLSDADRGHVLEFRVQTLSLACRRATCPNDGMRDAMEAQIAAAMSYGAANDLDWWLRFAARGRPESVPDDLRVMGQVQDIARAAADLQHGMARVRSAYAQSGGTWGQ